MQSKRLVALFAFLALAILSAKPLLAQDIECDAHYTVQPGDTLTEISQIVYGRATNYQMIVDYNPGVLVNPNEVPIGMDLYIPCEQGSAPGEVPELAETPDRANVRILTGTNYPPYVDRGLPAGGFSFELVEQALQFRDQPADYQIDVIDDWGAHLTTLLAGGAYDLAFPWFLPDCSQRDRLGDAGQWRCVNLHFSQPLHEIVVAFYIRDEDTGEIRTASDIEGKRLCRPDGYFTHDLAVKGLMPPKIIRVAGSDPTDCFERLVSGEVDVVTLNADTADQNISRLGIENEVSELIDLATIETLHVVGMRTNPKTRTLLLRIDQGLNGLHKNGIFTDLAAKHLAGN